MALPEHNINKNLQSKGSGLSNMLGNKKSENKSLLGDEKRDYAYNVNKKLEHLVEKERSLNHEDFERLEKVIGDPKYRGIVSDSTLKQAQRDLLSISKAEKAKLNPWDAKDHDKIEHLNETDKYFKDNIIGK